MLRALQSIHNVSHIYMINAFISLSSTKYLLESDLLVEYLVLDIGIQPHSMSTQKTWERRGWKILSSPWIRQVSSIWSTFQYTYSVNNDDLKGPP